jgi:hypothetical protein
MRLRECELSVQRVTSAIRLLELIDYNDSARLALKELRPLLTALEFEFNSLKGEVEE